MMTDSDTSRQDLRDRKVTYRQELVRVLHDVAEGSTALTLHAADQSNPHQVRADQVSLDHLENYPMASTLHIMEGADATRYVRPTHLPLAVIEHFPETTVTSDIRTPQIQIPVEDAVGVDLIPTVHSAPYTFITGSGVVLLHRAYEIDLATGDWSSPIAQWVQADDMASVCPVSLSPGTAYLIRARDVSTSAVYSEWSYAVPFTTADTPP